MISAQVLESFQITGRGTAVVIDKTTQLPVGICLKATIYRPDGSYTAYKAWKEWLLRREKEPLEDEVFLLVGAATAQVPIGATITFQTDELRA